MDFEQGRNNEYAEADAYKKEIRDEYDTRFYNKFLSTQRLFQDLNKEENLKSYKEAHAKMEAFEKALNISLSPAKVCCVNSNPHLGVHLHVHWSVAR